ncbi:hypothetical protein [Streptomyces omiyaensis]|uniref:hypothetical protein n=1 Tax=Streptomyces omiyaensis TaxID=68247 RepID=UPI001E35D761|nr:hypothetical protein [Streptomyces omiyaensis]
MLFLAVVFFVVGKAAVIRNGAQTAADAAVLAAAQDARDQLREGWLGVIDDPLQWQSFVDGDAYIDTLLACRSATDFAVSNGAEVDECSPIELGFRVTVHSTKKVGDSIVPGVEDQQGRATAVAVIEPRCSFDPPAPTQEPEPTRDPDPTPVPNPTSTPSAEPDEEPEPITGLVCDGEGVSIDPEDPVLPAVSDLFRIRLTGDDE